jgi:hypothetical protein
VQWLEQSLAMHAGKGSGLTTFVNVSAPAPLVANTRAASLPRPVLHPVMMATCQGSTCQQGAAMHVHCEVAEPWNTTKHCIWQMKATSKQAVLQSPTRDEYNLCTLRAAAILSATTDTHFLAAQLLLTARR